MKQCSACKQDKPFCDFQIDRSKKTGFSYRCKSCIKELRGDRYRARSSPRNLSPQVRVNEENRKRQYKKDHPEVISAINRRTYVQRKDLRIECTTTEVKQFMKGNPVCARCDSDEKLTLDHIIPVIWDNLSRHGIDNFQVLCNQCNSSKNGHISIDFRKQEDCLDFDLRDLI